MVVVILVAVGLIVLVAVLVTVVVMVLVTVLVTVLVNVTHAALLSAKMVDSEHAPTHSDWIGVGTVVAGLQDTIMEVQSPGHRPNVSFIQISLVEPP